MQTRSVLTADRPRHIARPRPVERRGPGRLASWRSHPLTGRQVAGALLASLAVSLLAIVSEYSGLDLYLAGQVFDPATGQWPYRSLFLTSRVLHTGGRNFTVLLGLAGLMLLVASYRVGRLAPYRGTLWFVLLAGVTGPLIVSLLKSVTHIYTPWSLARFGGDMPYIRLFDSAPPGSPPGHAFPGGHASAGFAWFGPYFLLLAADGRRRGLALLFPLLLGGVFSATQELRGAHFLSHDLITLAICWTSALGWALVFSGRQAGRQAGRRCDKFVITGTPDCYSWHVDNLRSPNQQDRGRHV